jgi:hypothetical protein
MSEELTFHIPLSTHVATTARGFHPATSHQLIPKTAASPPQLLGLRINCASSCHLRNNAHKSHCDPPVNFPTELLHKYDPTCFPEREFRHYCAGHLLPTDAARPSLAASTIRSLKRPAAIAITRKYKGMILDTVTPVNLIRFWSARRDYARLGGDDPVAAAIGAQVCRHRRSA